MMSVENISEIFKNFVKQSYNDSVNIEFEDGLVDYRISLNYIIENNSNIKNNNNPTLTISNYKVFIEKLTELMNKKYEYHFKDKEYMMLTENGYRDFLLLGIICNMQQIDFDNPINYLQRQINAYDVNYDTDNRRKTGDFKLGNENVEIYESDKKNIATMESMVSKCFIMKLNNEEYLLPKVHYYISDGKVYILGIQNSKNQSKNNLCKKIDRYFRKMDKGLEEYEQSKNGEIDGVKDVSVSALASLTLFFSSLKEYKEFYLIDYLPLRYANKFKSNISEEEVKEIDRIQTNITNKFLMTGVRLCEHFDNMDYDFFNGILNICLDNYKHQEGNIIYDIYESIKTIKKR